MASNEPRFRHIGLSTDGAVVFCALDNGASYAMPIVALERAEDWDPRAKPETAAIVHDGYAANIEFNNGINIDFAADFVVRTCEPPPSRRDSATSSGVGERIRAIRKARGMTLDDLAARCGVAKPNLSRLEHDKVYPTLETLRKVAAALGTHPAMLVANKKPNDAWKWALYQFNEWRRSLAPQQSRVELVRVTDMIETFLATWPEFDFGDIRKKLLAHADRSPQAPRPGKAPVDSKKRSHAEILGSGLPRH